MLMLWELLFFLRKSLQFYQMLYIIHLLFTDGFPSGQRGQTVNLLAPPSKVRILLHPANLALTSLRCRSYFFCAKRKPQRGRKAAAPLHTPRAFFRSAWLWRTGVLLTCVCMRRCWERKVEPRVRGEGFGRSRCAGHICGFFGIL